MNETKARKKYKKKFDKEVQKLLGGTRRTRYYWELINTTDQPRRLYWREFAGGNHTQAVVAELTIKGKTYWVTASTRIDEGALGYLLLLGPLGLLLMDEKIVVTFWKENPRYFDCSIHDYWGYQPPVKTDKHIFVHTPGDLSNF
ncbi:MAG TPA: hypothetical protein VFT59_00635 [Candidatus Saccharimonadales bacterium]|nr:hypothetical protein [Candidatus Saccharimonadales bacterium]